MFVVLIIAFRNLREHPAKTLIVGSIIGVGLMIIVVGSSLIDTAEVGVQSLYTENFTGDIIITSAENKKLSLFLNGSSVLDGDLTPRMENPEQLRSYLECMPEVASTVTQVTGMAIAEVEGQGNVPIQLFGVSLDEYTTVFPNTFELVNGRLMEADETGIVLSESTARRLESQLGRPVFPGDSLILSATNNATGTKVREVPVQGVVRFPREPPDLSFVSYVDLNTLRVLLGLTQRLEIGDEFAEEPLGDTGELSEESLFGSEEELLSEPETLLTSPAEKDLFGILGDLSEADLYREIDGQAYHYLLVTLEDGVRPERVIRGLNRHFDEEEWPFKAYDWVPAAGNIASLVSGFRLVFSLLIVAVAAVAVIIIMNTLVISVTERIGEIGMMRAIGARQPFIRRMIILETVMISVIFGLAGIFLGIIVLRIIGIMSIEASGLFLEILFGGAILHPVLTSRSIVTSLATVVAAGVIAAAYPASVALKIEPIRAMRRY